MFPEEIRSLTCQGTKSISHWRMVISRHVFAKGPDCPVLASYQIYVVLPKIAQKRQKLEPNSEDLVIFVK